MSVQVRYRREAAAFLSSFVGAQGELLVDTTNNRVQVHDGATPGGWPAARLVDLPSSTSPLALVQGGTGLSVSSANALLVGLGAIGRTNIADAAYVANVGDRTIAFTVLTTARTVTLPAAGAYPTGTALTIVDESGGCSLANAITVARAGSDTVNGAASTAITSAYGYVALESNGASKWTVIDSVLVGAGSASAGSLTGSALASNVVASSLTSVGTLTGGATGAGFTLALGSSSLTGAVPVGNGGTGATTASTALSSLGGVATATLGQPNGVATLGGDGRLAAAQVPSSLLGAVVYQGTWNAATNTPALTSGTGTKGNYYKVSTAGATALDGVTQWNAGDTAIFDGTTWDKIDGVANEVLSVNGYTGTVVLKQTDIAGTAKTGANADITALTGLTTPLSVAQGGTGATTGPLALVALGAVGRTAVNDASATATAASRTIAFTAITAARSVTLPAASTYPTGTTLTIVDEAGSCSATNTITLTAAGSDRINGAASSVLSLAYGYLALTSNGTNAWTIVDQSTASMGQQAAGSVAISGGRIDATAIGATTPAAIAATTLSATGAVALPVNSLGLATQAQAPAMTLRGNPTGATANVADATLTAHLDAAFGTAQGALLVRGASGWAPLAPGTSGNVLTSNGSGANPSYQTPASGGSSGPQNNFAATANPTSSNDSTQGYAVGSIWFRSDTGDTWRCRAATAGAAVWLRMDAADFFGYVSGNWYYPNAIAPAAGTASPAAGRIYFLPWINKQRCTLSALGVRVTTVSSGGNAQISVYAANPMTRRPIGPPLVTTASMSMSTATPVNAAVSQQLDAGMYFLAVMMDNTTSVLVGAATTGSPTAGLVGTATESNLGTGSFALHLYYPATFGTWPDMTSNNLTELATSTAYTPLPHFQVGSTP